MKGWSNPSAGGSEGDTPDCPDQPLWIFPSGNGRGEASSGGTWSVLPLIQALRENKSPHLGAPQAVQSTNDRDGFISRQYQWRGSFSQATACYRSQNESPKRCCGFSLGFLQILDCTELSSGTWSRYKKVTTRNIWKLCFLKPSEIWQFHFMGYVYMDTCKFLSSFIWT